MALTPLQSLGDVLRRRREELGVSLEELQEQTKIRVRYLEALEDGDWDVLPGDVYARGFVRRYAESVRLDGFDLLRAYVDLPRENPLPVSGGTTPSASKPTPGGVSGEVEHTAAAPEVVDAQGLQPSEPARAQTEQTARDREGVAPSGTNSTKLPRAAVSGGTRGDWRQRSATAGRTPRRTTAVRRGFGGQAAVVVGILIVLGGGWWLVHQTGHPRNQTPGGAPTNNSLSNQSGGTNNTSTENTTSSGNTLSGNGGTGASQTPGNSANVTGPGAGTGNTVQVTAQPFQSSNPPTQTYTVKTTSPLSVTLTVGGSACWVSVTADGTVIDNSETLQPGTSRTWNGNQSVSIYVGHPPSISVTINGQSVTLPPQVNPYHLVFQKSGG